jgi:hypothetical protein
MTEGTMAGGQDSSRYAISRPKVSISCALGRRSQSLHMKYLAPWDVASGRDAV